MKVKTEDQDLIEISIQLAEKLDAAWNQRDPEAMANLFHEDADFQFHNGLLIRGRKRIKRYYAEKVFPTLLPGWRHITRSARVRRIAENVVIGDGKADLVDISVEDPEKGIQRRLKVTTVSVLDNKEWRFSAVRVMVPAEV